MKINTNIDIEIKSKKLRTVLLILFILLLFFFIGYQFYTSYGKRANIETSTAVYQTVYKDISTEGFVIRNEHYVTNQYSGTVVPALSNGSKVSIGDTVARVYSTESGARNDARLKELEQDIEYYRSISAAAAGTMPADITHYKRKVFLSSVKFSDSAEKNDFGSISTLAREFREALTKKQIVCGIDVDVSDTLNSLTNEYQVLSGQAGSYSPITADVSGYYVNTADGYENAVDFDSVKSIDVAMVDTLLSTEASQVPVAAEGKLVTEFNWYIVCNIPIKESLSMQVGEALNIGFSNASVSDLRMIIAAINEDKEAGKASLILKSNNMDASVASLRKCSIRIRTDEHEGFILEPRAVRTIDGKTGVFVHLGNLARFKLIDITYSDDTMILANNVEGEDGYIRQFDEVILEGTDLYDGKIIS